MKKSLNQFQNLLQECSLAFLPFLYYFSVYVLEPINWFKLVNLSFGKDMRKTVRMARSFARYGMKKMFLRNTSSFKKAIEPNKIVITNAV